MNARTRLDRQTPKGQRRHYAYAFCSEREYAVIKRFAAKEGLSISDFVRRCVNGYLVEQGDDVELLTEFNRGDDGR